MGLSADAKTKRRREILAAATEVFIEKGFAGASLLEIATRARASKETLYSWFGTKTQLFGLLLEEGMKELGGRVSSEVAQGTPESVLYVIALETLRLVNLSPLMRLFSVAGAEARHNPELRTMLVERGLKHSGVASYLAACRARGQMRFDDPNEMASIFIAMAQGEWPARLSLGVVERLSDDEVDRHARIVSRMFMRAVAP